VGHSEFLTTARPARCYPRRGVGSGVISPWHIAIFALVVLLVFGPKKLPEMGRSLGKGIRELKDGLTHHVDAQLDEPTALPPDQPVSPSVDRDSI
jgi:sec-independent protein translocase protein TatA